jgi:predicted membrane-bound spermidine synthase
MDGRSYITNCDKKYDIIMVDAYQDITIPFQMSSLEFFTIVGDHLNPGGVMVVNMKMKTNKEGGIVDYLCGTIKNVFKNAYTVDCGTNRELFACNGFDLKKSLNNNLTKVENIDLKNHLTFIKDNLVYVEDKPYILTDDKAPVKLLGMDVLDDMIFDELEYYRGKLKGKSISEIIYMVMNGELF